MDRREFQMGRLEEEVDKLPKIPVKGIVKGVVVLFILIAALVVAGGLYNVVPAGFYQISQQWFTGSVDAKMEPGLWFPIGHTWDWPKEKTFFFTHDKDGKHDTDKNYSIEVRFNDGSICNISGTCRVIFPQSRTDAINLVIKSGYTSPEEVMGKLVLPTLRNSLSMSANLMSARQSYSEKRPDFISWSYDQIQGGMFDTSEEWKKVEDPVTGEKVSKYVKVIKRDTDGKPQHLFNPLKGTGITLANFEVKKFDYSKEVAEQIAKQQSAIMDVETARAEAQKAEQNKLTEKAKGEANAIQAQWEEETKKARAVVVANQKKEVAEIDAAQKLKVAELDKQSAEQTKLAAILVAEGESKARELKMKADNYQAMKIEAWKDTQLAWADAFKTRKVPTTVFGSHGSGGEDKEFMSGQQMLQLMGMKALGFDIGIGAEPAKVPAK
jgi:regulator of protease activity HflC (stomatin/prohibitin superfamily)